MSKRYTLDDIGLSRDERKLLLKLNSPEKIQRFIAQDLAQNFEEDGPTLMSLRETLRSKKAHCIEAAFVAAAAFWVNGELPLLLDLRAEDDDDHVVALFKRNGHWGAISKSNHSVVRYRDPIYRTLRELSLSYVHEYYNKNYKKTLREYSRALDLRRVDPSLWVSGGRENWKMAEILDQVHHYPLMNKTQAKRLVPLDPTERDAAKILSFSRSRK